MMAIKQCSKCGADFGCMSPVAGCWCEQYTIPVEALGALRADYADCLCPTCLANYATPVMEKDELSINED